MLQIKEVIGRGSNGYSNGTTEKVSVIDKENKSLNEFMGKEHFDKWAVKMGIKLEDAVKTSSSFSEIQNKKVVTYEVDQTIKEVFLNKKGDLPVGASKMIGLVCGEVVFCYANVEGNVTTIYRPQPSGDWYELLPEPIQDMIINLGIRPLDLI